MFYILLNDPATFFLLLPALALSLLVGITVHEFSHAFAANLQGDRLPKSLGRLTLNPLRHLDPIGSIMLFVVGFGWGKPVPVNPVALRSGPKTGMALVSAAGPISNLVMAGIIALIIQLNIVDWHPPFTYRPFAIMDASWIAADLVGYLIFYNLILAVFNLIPLAPLDGFKVAVGILPREMSISYAQTERYGPMILILVFAFDYFTGVGILSRIMLPIVDAVGRVLIGRGF